MRVKMITKNPAPSGPPPAGIRHARAPNETEGLRTPRFPLRPCRILVPVDFSDASLWTLRHTARLAERNGSSIVLLHVLDFGSFLNDLRGALLTKPEQEIIRGAETRLRWLANRELPASEAPFLLVKSGRVGPEIIRAAREARCDLIVLTVDNHSAVERARHFLFGNTAAWIERHAPCPVLTLSLPKRVHDPLEHKFRHKDRRGVLPQQARTA